jgi:cell division protein FtsN
MERRPGAWPRGLAATRGRSAFATVFLTFSLLLVVMALGFALGRALVGKVSVRRPLEFAKQEGQKAGSAQQAVQEPGPPAAPAYVPAPAEPQGGANAPAEGSETSPPAPEQPGPSPSPGPAEQPEGGATGPPPLPAPQATEGSEERFAVQVGSFISPEGARELADSLARAGYPSRVEREQSGERVSYRVLTGRYRTEYAARKAAEQLTREGFQAFIVKR